MPMPQRPADLGSMSPSIFTSHALRFYFYSREEPCAHAHVDCETGKAKIWMEPRIEAAHNEGLSVKTSGLQVG
ncbi:hypothetical protein D3C83_146540 [compost metagenome]